MGCHASKRRPFAWGSAVFCGNVDYPMECTMKECPRSIVLIRRKTRGFAVDREETRFET